MPGAFPRARPLNPTSTVLAALAAIVPATPAGASWPGRNGKIAVIFHQGNRGGEESTELRFVSRRRLGRASPCERFETDPDFNAGICPGAPAWSPDGSRLALQQDDRIAIANADGGAIRPLPQFTDADLEPAWSPDGTRLVFAGRRGDSINLYVVRADGTGLRQLTDDGDSGEPV